MKMHNTVAITAWEEEERPREKLAMWGKNLLSLTDLLAIIIGSGNKQFNAVDLARSILNQYPASKLPYLKVNDLCAFPGIGKAKAVSIIAALELGKRCSREENELPKKIVSSKDVYDLLKDKFANLEHEEFWMVCLNTGGRVISIEMVSKGGINRTIVDPVIVMRKAIEHMSNSIILAHNHPSGNLAVSSADRRLTTNIFEICQLLNIGLLDHVIFTDNGFTSFADEGYID